ncbi:MAG: CotH kinase family protein [Flavobacteriales bacterium]|jgi:spore coat protein CotH
MKVVRLPGFLAALCTPLAALFAQPSIPEWSDAFLQSEVAVVRIDIHPDSLDALLNPENWYNEYEWPARFIYESSVRTDTIENVGFRLRGNTSMNASKKSFKVSINAFTPGLNWLGLEKLNLNGNANDPSLLRAKLCWDMIRHFHLAGSRTSFVRLYINDEFKGVYLNTEHIDEQFAQAYFRDETSHLWKCTYPADLNYLGSNPELYKLEAWGRRVYELKTNTEQDDYSALAEFIDALNNTPANTFQCQLERVFNVDDYLKYLAIDVLTGNWDNYAYNQNNFYLLRNEVTGVIEYIPYDLDNTLGIDWLGMNWSDRIVYAWSPDGQSRPLYELLLNQQEYRNQFSNYLQQFIDEWFNDSGLVAQAEALQAMISPYMESDTYYPLDFGFDLEDFENAINEAAGGQVSLGIRDFVQVRAENALNQLEAYSPLSVVNYMQGTLLGDDLLIQATTTTDLEAVAVWREWPGGSWQSAPVTFLSEDAPSGELVVYCIVTPPSSTSSVEFSVLPINEWLLFDNGGCPTRVIHRGDSPNQIVINEVQSLNTATLADNAGEYDDWIELYNSGTNAVYLGNSYISDEPLDWNKWRLPNVTLDPGDFLLLWADSDAEQGPLHLGFRLNGNSEYLGIFETVQRAPRSMDEVICPLLATDESYGRITDGAAEWTVFTNPTPNGPNGVVNVEEADHAPFVAYPNPATDHIRFSEPISGTVYSPAGNAVMNFPLSSELRIEHLASGVYFIHAGVRRIRFVK